MLSDFEKLCQQCNAQLLVIKKCADKFREYEEAYLAQSTDESTEKAFLANELAEECEALFTTNIEQSAINTRLIKKAPELLESLKDLLRASRRFHVPNNLTQDSFALVHYIEYGQEIVNPVAQETVITKNPIYGGSVLNVGGDK